MQTWNRSSFGVKTILLNKFSLDFVITQLIFYLQGLRVAYMKFPTRLVTKADSADYQSFTEADIAILEEFMEEALNMAGTGPNGGRLSGYAPSVASTRTAGNTNEYSSTLIYF